LENQKHILLVEFNFLQDGKKRFSTFTSGLNFPVPIFGELEVLGSDFSKG
jgi:hypothetical protein